MPDTIELLVERWDGPNYSKASIPIKDQADLADAIGGLEEAESASLTMEQGDRSLIIGASRGKYTVCAILGFDDIFDMRTSSDEMAGVADFVEGGQSVQITRDHLLSVEQAIAAASEFLRTATVDVSGWDRQS